MKTIQAESPGPTVGHVILTRFNLPSKGREQTVRSTAGWLETRLEMFDRTCLPSVLAQTVQDFKWLIFFDPDSPSWLKDRVATDVDRGLYTASYRACPTRDDVLADIGSLLGRRADYLLTTNLDNDDGLARDFVERLQKQPLTPDATVLYFSDGLVLASGRVYRRLDRRNAFPSLRERWHLPVTVWVDWHNRLQHHARVVEVRGDPAWLQVVHGSNVSNRVRGHLDDASRYRKLFGQVLDPVEAPRGSDLVVDRFVRWPVRMARDYAIAGAKAVALRSLGPRGLDRLVNRSSPRGSASDEGRL